MFLTGVKRYRVGVRPIQLGIALGAVLSLQNAVADCPQEWLPGEGAPGVVGSGTVFASTMWDPYGAGPASPLAIFGGTMIGAGDVAVNSIAAWDGSEWHALGDGLLFPVRALTVYQGDLIAAAGNNTFGGTGPDNGVARWDGESWQAVSSEGFQNVVWALTVFEGDLYAGGLFSNAGGTPATNIARWDGRSWSALGAGIPNGVMALTEFDGQLIAGGIGVKSWDPTSETWQPFGPSLTGTVHALSTYGGELVVGGWFQTTSGGPNHTVAQWDGATWQPLVSDMNDHVYTLLEYEGDLIAGGHFTFVNGNFASRMARWDGSSWFPILGLLDRRCDSLVIFDGDLYAGGGVTEPSGLQAEQVARWDGDLWSYVGDGMDGAVFDFATYGDDLIVGGWFGTAGDILATGIARRDSTGQWHSMGDVGGGDGYVSDLVNFGEVLIASGSFTAIGRVPVPGIAQWNGVSWQPFGDVPVGEMLVHEGDLFAAGNFGSNKHVAQWNSSAQDWEPLGTFPPNVGIFALTMFEGDLMAGGIGGIGNTASVWRWAFDAPGTWEPVGQHLGSTSVNVLTVFNGELHAGGTIDGGLMRLDGASWVVVGGGLFLGNEFFDDSLIVFDLRVVGNELVVGGAFSYAGEQQYSRGSVQAYHVASWNGTNWQGFEEGANDAVVTVHEHDGEIFIGGWFDMAGGAPNGHWAHWGSPCPEEIVGDLDGNGAVDGADLGLLLGAWGPCRGCAADLTGDGVVDGADLGVILGAWTD